MRFFIKYSQSTKLTGGDVQIWQRLKTIAQCIICKFMSNGRTRIFSRSKFWLRVDIYKMPSLSERVRQSYRLKGFLLVVDRLSDDTRILSPLLIPSVKREMRIKIWTIKFLSILKSDGCWINEVVRGMLEKICAARVDCLNIRENREYKNLAARSKPLLHNQLQFFFPKMWKHYCHGGPETVCSQTTKEITLI